MQFLDLLKQSAIFLDILDNLLHIRRNVCVLLVWERADHEEYAASRRPTKHSVAVKQQEISENDGNFSNPFAASFKIVCWQFIFTVCRNNVCGNLNFLCLLTSY